MRDMNLCWLFLVTGAAAASRIATLTDPSLLTAGKHYNGTTKSEQSTETSAQERELEDSCECVPFYLCDMNDISFHTLIDNASGQSYCPVFSDVCCNAPKRAPIPKNNFTGCGYRNTFNYTKKNFDNTANFGEFPWVVAILNQNDSFLGAGVLIHPQVVMTGAHIGKKNEVQGDLKIRAGEWDTQTTNEMYKYQERNVTSINLHPDYNKKTLFNDMAILRLQSPVEMDEHISTLCLPAQNETFDGYKGCIANGWGKDIFGKKGQYSVKLKKVELSMVAHAQCEEALQRTRLGRLFHLHSTFVCAGGDDQDTCTGDGGAPLACPVGLERYKLAGLVAWGIGCGQRDVPAVYVNVPAFRDWVDDNMNRWQYGTSSYTINT